MNPDININVYLNKWIKIYADYSSVITRVLRTIIMHMGQNSLQPPPLYINLF